MYNIPGLQALRTFDAAARRMSFKEAAKELSVTPTAVSHQIARLEDQLDTKLFERRVRQVSLTEDGARLANATESAFAILQRSVDAIDRRRSRKIAVVGATNAFASKWLIPRASRFGDVAPGWTISILASEKLADIDSGEVDVAIRYGGDTVKRGQTATPLVSDKYIPVCTPSYWQQLQAGDAPMRLIHAEWYRKDRPAPSWEALSPALGNAANGAQEFILSDELSAISAALAGQGIALASALLVAQDIELGLLIRPFEGEIAGADYSLITAAGASVAAETFKSWIVGEMALYTENPARSH
ncbi:MAG: LysR substrate-binding domain-containing protein [Parasphingopyxis sp.]